MNIKGMKINSVISGLGFFLCIILLFSACSPASYELKSPNGKTKLIIKEKGCKINYSLDKENKSIIFPSKLGFVLEKGDSLNRFKIKGTMRSSLNETWEQPWGESRYVQNNYNELKVTLQEPNGLCRKVNVIFRLFDDGIGYRYEFPQQPNLDSLVIISEETEFKLPQVHKAWWIPASNAYYECIAKCSKVNELDTVRTPLTMETPDGKYLSIHEANLTDYPKMNLTVRDSATLCASLVPWSTGVAVYAKTPFLTPWRTIIIGDTPGDLVTSNMMLNLNEPSKIEDTSWIKPAKYLGIWWEMHLGKGTWYYGPNHSATTQNTKRYIDFASKNGIPGVLVEGWNEGWEGNWMKNDSLDFTKPYPDFNIKEITDYAASKKVELIGHHETAAITKTYEKQLDKAFAFYQKYGVHVVKTGYVNNLMDFKEAHDGQYGVRHYRKVIETAAKYHISIDNHEPVMPTGLQRTWPNLMTQEGVRGQEHNAWSPDGGNPPEHTTVLPFTRGLAGPMDFTFGTFNFTNKAYPGTRVNTTICKQLALYVILYSPLQMASDLPENYEGIKAFDFIKDVPTDWDETRVIDAKIGDYSVFARKDRNSSDWYVGCITDEKERFMNFTLSFLEPNTTYLAQIYSDGDNAEWKTNPTSFKYEEKFLTSKDQFSVRLATSGGVAIRFIKQNADK